jgi:CBS domain-containing protein
MAVQIERASYPRSTAVKASDIMTRNVISIHADEAVVDAARRMIEKQISGLPVVDPSGRVIGIVTEGDFLRRSEIGTRRRRARWLEFLVGPGRLASEYVRESSRKVDDVMTRNPSTIGPDATLEEIVHLMEQRRIKRLPVVDGGKLVGTVSRANLVRALTSCVREAKPVSDANGSIREQILAELGKQPWAPHIDVVVNQGVVDLWGVLTDEREREAIIVATENVDGVRHVHDHLVWIEPHTGFTLQSAEDREKPVTR